MSPIVALMLALSIAVPANAYVVGGTVRGGVITGVTMGGGSCVHTAALWRCDVAGDAAPVHLDIRRHGCAPVMARAMINYVWTDVDVPPMTCVYLPEVFNG